MHLLGKDITMTDLELQKMAVEVRKGIITAVHGAKAGHPGGSLSAADVFTYLYFEEMNIDPKEPKKLTVTALYYRKGIRLPVYIPFLQTGDISR